MAVFGMDDIETSLNDNRDKLLEAAIKKIADGNVDSIGEIFDITQNALYAYILSFLKNPEDTEDVLQDTYVKICHSAHLYQSQGKPMAWIYTIARNLALMKLRSKARFTDIEEYEWESFRSENECFRVEDQMVLTNALNNLSEEESQIVMMHAVGGVKHREIASMFDMPLATVLSKYNRAIKKLKKLLS